MAGDARPILTIPESMPAPVTGDAPEWGTTINHHAPVIC